MSDAKSEPVYTILGYPLPPVQIGYWTLGAPTIELRQDEQYRRWLMGLVTSEFPRAYLAAHPEPPSPDATAPSTPPEKEGSHD